MTLLLVVLVTSTTQLPERSARLLTEVSQADQVRGEYFRLKAERPFAALRITGITAFALGAAVPTYLLIAGAVGTGITAWFAPAMAGAAWVGFFATVGAAIPPLAWVAMVAVAVGGLALTIASFVADAPRQAELRRLKQLDRTLRRAPPSSAVPPLLTF